MPAPVATSAMIDFGTKRSLWQHRLSAQDGGKPKFKTDPLLRAAARCNPLPFPLNLTASLGQGERGPLLQRRDRLAEGFP
jgi:hypothetical protein